LESELEGRFIEALRRTPEGEPPRSVTHHVVNGKEGFYLRSEFGNYLIEPQVELGHSQGVTVQSRADFVFYPERPEPGELPIVVFTDGYEYHADPNAGLRTGIDTAQRMALMRSGRYRVWSLTWDDVQEQFRLPIPKFDVRLLPPGAKFGQLLNSLDSAGGGYWNNLSELSSFGALMLLLGSARGRSWASYSRAFAISFLENDPDTPDCLRIQWQRSHSDGSPLFRAEGSMKAASLQERDFDALFVRLQLFDDYAHRGPIEWKRAWRESLRLGNLLQFIEHFEFVTSLGSTEELYRPILDQGSGRGDSPVPDRLAPLLEVVDTEVKDLCRRIAEQHKVLPEAGFELTSEQGEIIATAELAWPELKIAVLLEHEADGARRFEAAGWRHFTSNSALSAPQPLLELLPNEVPE
jgi:DEAD/DEAH box helicase domain-containing protein